MAAITPTVTRTDAGRGPTEVFWEQINQDDTGASFATGGPITNGTVQFYGTFDTGTWSVSGSIDGTNFSILKDTSGAAISGTADSTFQFATAVKHIRIDQAGGTTSDVDVRMIYV